MSGGALYYFKNYFSRRKKEGKVSRGWFPPIIELCKSLVVFSFFSPWIQGQCRPMHGRCLTSRLHQSDLLGVSISGVRRGVGGEGGGRALRGQQ